jgi:integrase
MPRTRKTRNPNGRSTIYQGADGYWHGRVTMGMKDDGTPDRRHVKRKEHADVVAAVQRLESERETGVVVRKKGMSPTVKTWLTEWVEHIAAPHVRYKTLEGYRNSVYNHLIPKLGGHRMDKIAGEPERFEKLYANMIREGYAPLSAHHVHRTARTAFREARNRKIITENPFEIVKAPRVDEREIEPFEIEEVQALITAALARRNGVRFVIALSLGTRKGESIGFRWQHLNTITKVLRVKTQRQRQTYEHGCSNPRACAESHHKTAPCKTPCKQHKHCPPPCPPACVKHAMHCPQRRGGVVEVDVKSKAGRRGIRLPDQLFDLLMTHKAAQDTERELAGSLWKDGDWMFAQPNGQAIDPRTDHTEWKTLLAEAGVRDARLHDARHTAATVLLVLGTSQRAVMDFMGWSNHTMARRYQHVTAAVQNEIAARLGGFLWAPK